MISPNETRKSRLWTRTQSRRWMVAGCVFAGLFVVANWEEPQGALHRLNTWVSQSSRNGNFSSAHASAAMSALAPDVALESANTTRTSMAAQSRTLSLPASNSRMVVLRASLALTSATPKDAASSVEVWLRQSEGYVASMDRSGSGVKTTVTYQLRVPSAAFDSLLSKLQTLGKVGSLSQTGQDVTSAYQGIEQSLQELRAEESAYARLYQRATTMSDMLKVQQALVRVRARISDLQNQEHGLYKSVEYGTINLTISPEPAPRSIPRTQNPMVRALSQSVTALLHSVLALVTFVAWLLPWGVVMAAATWVFRRVKRRS